MHLVIRKKMTKVNHCVKSNLSGRRVVVSISSTSDKSCLWKPGFIILEVMDSQFLEDKNSFEANLRITET